MNTNKISPIEKSAYIFEDAILHPESNPATQDRKRESIGITIVSEPIDVITKPGTYVNFSAIVNCTKPSFQWFNKFGDAIPRKTSNKLAFCPVREEDFGFYRLQITDLLTKRSELTKWVELKKSQPRKSNTFDQKFYVEKIEEKREENKPKLLQSPEGGNYQQGDTVRLNGYFENANSYQWFKDGVALEGCIGNVLLISNIYHANTGKYELAAYNGKQMERSEPANVAIY